MGGGGGDGGGCHGGDDQGGEGGGVRGGGGEQDAGQLYQLHPAFQAGIQCPGITHSIFVGFFLLTLFCLRLMIITLMEKHNKVDRGSFYSIATGLFTKCNQSHFKS